MKITERRETRKDVKAIGIRLVGDYQKVNYIEAWNKLLAYCHKHKIDDDCPDAEYINIYHDNSCQRMPYGCLHSFTSGEWDATRGRRGHHNHIWR